MLELPESPPQLPVFPLRADSLSERLVDGELVLYDSKLRRVHVLNSTAAFVWRCCDGQHDQAGLVAALGALYPESQEAVEKDVPEVLVRLLAEGLLRS